MLLLKAYTLLFLSAIYIYIAGFVFNRILINNAEKNISIIGLLGLFFLSLIALITNFAFALTKLNNTIILLIILVIFLITINNKLIIKRILIYSSITSLISFIIIIFDTVYRPDAGLYHLPYTKIINDHKIILGINHLEFRYGHTSILQYLAAINNNYIFYDTGILLPLTFFFSIPVVFLFEKIFTKEKNFIKYLAFLYLFFVLYEMNRYGDFGNDTPAHILFFITTIIFLNNNELVKNKSNFKIVGTFCIFVFFIKQTLFFILLIPLYYIIIEKKFYLIKLKYNIFLFFIIFLWCAKNFLISSCFVYPLSFTCNSQVLWSSYDIYTHAHPDFVTQLSEAWAKDIPNNKTNLGIDTYIKEFNWVSTWLSNHFLKIINRLFPLFLLLMILVIFKSKYFNKQDFDINKKKIKFLFILNFAGLFYWFIKFPIFRYGKSYIVCTIIFLFIFFINFIYKKFKKEKYLFKSIFFLIIIVFIAKNIKRTYLNYDNFYMNYPFPEIYSLDLNNKLKNYIPISQNNKISFFKTEKADLCMYGKSPCSCCVLNEDKIKLNYIYSYKLFSIK